MTLTEKVLKIKGLKSRLRELDDEFVNQNFSFKNYQLIDRKNIKREIKLIHKEIYKEILLNDINVNYQIVKDE